MPKRDQYSVFSCFLKACNRILSWLCMNSCRRRRSKSKKMCTSGKTALVHAIKRTVAAFLPISQNLSLKAIAGWSRYLALSKHIFARMSLPPWTALCGNQFALLLIWFSSLHSCGMLWPCQSLVANLICAYCACVICSAWEMSVFISGSRLVCRGW